MGKEKARRHLRLDLFGEERRTSRLLGLPSDHKAFAVMGLGIPAFRNPKYTER